jgi:hypothetical protein
MVFSEPVRIEPCERSQIEEKNLKRIGLADMGAAVPRP